MRLFGSSNFICSQYYAPLVFRARFIVSVVCFIVFSANPVSPSDRCMVALINTYPLDNDLSGG